MTSLEPFSVFSPAKVNLNLHVTDKRHDGYHSLDSFVGFSDFGDQITITPSDVFSFEVEGPFADKLSQEAHENLVIRTKNLISKRFDIETNAQITLTKNIPVAAGLGGGSSNAAATFYGLEKLYSLKISKEERHTMLCSLGADVPVCYHGISTGGIIRMGGIGDEISLMAFHDILPCLLVNPRQHCATLMIFEKMNRDNYSGEIASFSDQQNLTEIILKTQNDLTSAAISHIPDIEVALNDLNQTPHCDVTRMSGSGATCFGIYSDMKHAQNAANIIQAKHPTWWVKPCLLNVENATD